MHRVCTSSAVCVHRSAEHAVQPHRAANVPVDWCLCRFPARSQHTGGQQWGQQSKPSAPPSAAFQSAN